MSDLIIQLNNRIVLVQKYYSHLLSSTSCLESGLISCGLGLKELRLCLRSWEQMEGMDGRGGTAAGNCHKSIR